MRYPKARWEFWHPHTRAWFWVDAWQRMATRLSLATRPGTVLHRRALRATDHANKARARELRTYGAGR